MNLFSSASSIIASVFVSIWVARDCAAASAGDTRSLNLEQLIQVALKNNAKLAELRGDINVAVAQERSAADWEDPEIRVSLSRDNDVELPQTERETRTTTTTRSGSSNESSKAQRDGQNERELRETESTEGFDSVTTTRTTRTIEHGARSETITEETWESSADSSSLSERSNITKESGGKTEDSERSETSSSNKNETLIDRTVENRQFDSDITTPDEDANIKLRLRVPNPFERKANIAKARAKIGLATAVLNSAEHELALAVRKSYADALAANERLKSAGELSSVHERLAGEVAGMGTWAKLEDEIAAQSDSFRSSLELPILELELERELTQLATLVGLSDPRRIVLDSKIAPTRVDLSGLDKAFLYQVAEGYRGDILSLVHKLKVSEFDLAAYNAKKIPWFTFVEGFYGVDYDRGYRSSDNYGIQFGMTIPLFTWFKNKGHEVIEQKQQTLNSKAAAVRSSIRAEVDSAVFQLGKASTLMDRFETRRRKYRSVMKESLVKAQKGGLQSNDARFRAEESLAKLDELRPNVHKSYNEAILMLEHAVGTSLDEVFSGDTRSGRPDSNALLNGEAEISAATASDHSTESGELSAPQNRRRPRNGPPHRR